APAQDQQQRDHQQQDHGAGKNELSHPGISLPKAVWEGLSRSRTSWVQSLAGSGGKQVLSGNGAIQLGLRLGFQGAIA
ncbi:MAG: hypothetical protein VX342_04760, partial [Pseudomonadota bacterium]|nr:hypothetical protein [Pseudomonadota bacterium]